MATRSVTRSRSTIDYPNSPLLCNSPPPAQPCFLECVRLPARTPDMDSHYEAVGEDSSDLSDLSSLLSSPRSRSPSLPPTPASSQEQEDSCILEDSTSLNEGLSKKRARDDDEVPAKKKRRITEPKPRTTEYLDLTMPASQCATDQKAQFDTLLKVLRKRRKIVVIAGAGISVSAGIPDFRSSTGLFTTLRSEHKLKASGKQLFDASVYQTDSATSSFHDMVRNLFDLVSNAQPTPFHQMLSSLGEEGRLMRLYTQNVDGIDVALPSLETSVPLNPKGPWPRTIQLHGGLEKMVCSKCNHLSKFQPLLFDGPRPPLCKVCIDTDKIRTDHAGKRSHGIGKLRPRMVLYNEHNPDEEAIGAVVSSDLRSRPDAVIVVGTSMKIPGVRRIVREMCGVVRGRRDGLAIWINRDPPPVGKEFEDCWDLVVKGSSDTVARISDASKSYMDCTDSDAERARAKDELVQVVIHSPVKGTFNHGMPTPSASPRPSKQLELSIKSKTQLPVKPKFVAKKQVEITSHSSSVPPKANPKSHISKPKGPAKIKTTKKVNMKTPSTAPSSTINQLFKQTKSTSASSTNPRKLAKEPLKREPPLKPALSATTASTFNQLFTQSKSTSVSSTVTKKTSQAAFRIQLPLPRQSYPPRSSSTIFDHFSSSRTQSVVPQTPINTITNDSHIFKYSPPAPVEPRVSLSTPYCRVPTTPDPPDWEPLTPIQFRSGGSNGSRRPELYSTPQPPSWETPTPRRSTWKHVSKRPDPYYTPPPPQFEPLTPPHRRSSGSNGLWGSECNSVSPNTMTRKFLHTVPGGSDELCTSPTTMTRRFWRTVGGPTSEKRVYNGVTLSPTTVPRNMDRLLN